jgi:DHA1 family tetracycline resistance protein-like MFS transporter
VNAYKASRDALYLCDDLVRYLIVGTSLSFIVQPAVQGFISNAVPADEQGKVQGAITSLLSLTAIIGPIIATSLFSFFTAPEQTRSVPGAPFFFGALLMLLGLFLALRTFRQPRPNQLVNMEV